MFASTCSTPSRSRRIATTLSSNSVRQLATIASKTGRVSVIEPLIADRMRAVAVWRSSASRVSLNSRTFSIAITAWSANVCSRPISAGANGRTSLRSSEITPTPRPRAAAAR